MGLVGILGDGKAPKDVSRSIPTPSGINESTVGADFPSLVLAPSLFNMSENALAQFHLFEIYIIAVVLVPIAMFFMNKRYGASGERSPKYSWQSLGTVFEFPFVNVFGANEAREAALPMKRARLTQISLRIPVTVEVARLVQDHGVTLYISVTKTNVADTSSG